MTLSEASLVINALMAKRRKDRKDRNETEWVHPCHLSLPPVSFSFWHDSVNMLPQTKHITKRPLEKDHRGGRLGATGTAEKNNSFYLKTSS